MGKLWIFSGLTNFRGPICDNLLLLFDVVFSYLQCSQIEVCQTFVPLDYIVVGSDSGRIVVLEYIPYKNVFERVILIDSFENVIIHSSKVMII